jgi:hypothetical protein
VGLHSFGKGVEVLLLSSALPLRAKKALDNLYTNMITYAMLPRQATFLDPLSITLTPLLRYSCKLFVAPENPNSFAIKQFQTLDANCPGYGIRRSSWRTPGVWGTVSLTRCLCASVAIDFYRLCFHRVTNPFSRKPFVCTSIQNPGGGGGTTLRPCDVSTFRHSDIPTFRLPTSGRSHCNFPPDGEQYPLRHFFSHAPAR